MYRLLDARGRCVSGATSHAPRYAKPELLAERPTSLELGHLEVEGSGEVDVLLPVRDPRRVQPLRRRLDRPAPRGAKLAKALIRQASAAADPARAADRARRPRQLDDQQARRVPPRRPRRDTLHNRPTPHRQPLLRGALQDPEVPPRVPPALREHPASTRVLPHILRLVQPHPPPLRDRPNHPSRRPPRPRPSTPRRTPARPRRRLRHTPSGSSAAHHTHQRYHRRLINKPTTQRPLTKFTTNVSIDSPPGVWARAAHAPSETREHAESNAGEQQHTPIMQAMTKSQQEASRYGEEAEQAEGAWSRARYRPAPAPRAPRSSHTRRCASSPRPPWARRLTLPGRQVGIDPVGRSLRRRLLRAISPAGRMPRATGGGHHTASIWVAKVSFHAYR